jgi:hypothetical protein
MKMYFNEIYLFQNSPVQPLAKKDERIGTSPGSYQNVISQYYIRTQVTFQHSMPSARAGFKSQRDFWDE